MRGRRQANTRRRSILEAVRNSAGNKNDPLAISRYVIQKCDFGILGRVQDPVFILIEIEIDPIEVETVFRLTVHKVRAGCELFESQRHIDRSV